MPKFVNHYRPEGRALPETDRPASGFQTFYGALLQGFPDATVEINEQLAERDLVATRKTFRGTHLGELWDLPPTGIWLGQNSSTNYANEVMIWNDMSNRGTCGGATVLTNANFGGSNGVPQQNWTLCKWGSSELIWYLTSGNETSGTVDVLSMLTFLESHGYLPANSGLNQIQYGFEICSTHGAATFTVSKLAITSSCKSGASC
jgi:SnoaL-like polyketide cyclase